MQFVLKEEPRRNWRLRNGKRRRKEGAKHSFSFHLRGHQGVCPDPFFRAENWSSRVWDSWLSKPLS